VVVVGLGAVVVGAGAGVVIGAGAVVVVGLGAGAGVVVGAGAGAEVVVGFGAVEGAGVTVVPLQAASNIGITSSATANNQIYFFINAFPPLAFRVINALYQ
jgi:hypothetical protein